MTTPAPSASAMPIPNAVSGIASPDNHEMLRHAAGGVANLGGGAMKIWGGLEMMGAAMRFIIPGGENGLGQFADGAKHMGLGWLAQKAAPVISGEGHEQVAGMNPTTTTPVPANLPNQVPEIARGDGSDVHGSAPQPTVPQSYMDMARNAAQSAGAILTGQPTLSPVQSEPESLASVLAAHTHDGPTASSIEA